MVLKSSLSRSDGEVAAAKRLTEGPTPSGVAKPFGPFTIRLANGPPPHGFATGRIFTSACARKPTFQRLPALHQSRPLPHPHRAHAKWGPASLPTPTIRYPSGRCPLAFIPVRFSCDRRPAKRRLRRVPELSGDGLVGPLSGAGRTWKALHHLFYASAEAIAAQAMDCISCPDRVRLNSWESRRSVTRVSVHFLVVPVRFLPAGLATFLRVPAVRRLRRPMVGS